MPAVYAGNNKSGDPKSGRRFCAGGEIRDQSSLGRQTLAASCTLTPQLVQA